MRIVLDTNVLVSGLLNPFGSSGEIVRMVFSGELMLCVDARILSEYQDVLYRSKFHFDKDKIAILVDFIMKYGQVVSSSPLGHFLPDRDDEPFLEVAVAGTVKTLITGNKVHYPTAYLEGIEILSPSEFIDLFRKTKKDTEPRH
jgi:uncharacterized protein